jgi:hypothetical protein
MLQLSAAMLAKDAELLQQRVKTAQELNLQLGGERVGLYDGPKLLLDAIDLLKKIEAIDRSVIKACELQDAQLLASALDDARKLDYRHPKLDDCQMAASEVAQLLSALYEAMAKGRLIGWNFDTVQVAALEALLREADEVDIMFRSPSFAAAAEKGRIVLELRKALLADDWDHIHLVISKLGNEAIVSLPEATLLSEKVQQRKDVIHCMAQLELALGEMDTRLVEQWLEKAAALQVNEDNIAYPLFADALELVGIARETLRKVADCDNELNRALATMDEKGLVAAIARAESIKHWGALVDQAKLRLDEVHEAKRRLLSALETGAPIGWSLASIEFDRLDQALLHSYSLHSNSAEGKILAAKAQAVREIRVAMKRDSWDTVASILSDPLLLDMSEWDEIQRAKQKLDFRQIVLNCVGKLEQAVQMVDEEQLFIALEEADRVRTSIFDLYEGQVDAVAAVELRKDEMEPSQEERSVISTSFGRQLVSAMNEAHGLFSEMQLMGKRIQAAINADDLAELRRAVRSAEELEYHMKMAHTGRAVLSRFGSVFDDLEHAMTSFDRREMAEALEAAQALGVKNATVQQIREWLAAPEKEYLLAALRRAQVNQQTERASELRVALFCLRYKESHEGLRLKHFRGLREPALFASTAYKNFLEKSQLAKSVSMKKKQLPSKEDLARTMLEWTLIPIHTSLTQLGKDAEKSAVEAFKKVMSFMGDYKEPYPERLATEVIRIGRLDAKLADEIYVQILKQLTANGSKCSLDRGIELLKIVIDGICPSAELADFVGVFILEHLSREMLEQFLNASAGDSLLWSPSL